MFTVELLLTYLCLHPVTEQLQLLLRVHSHPFRSSYSSWPFHRLVRIIWKNADVAKVLTPPTCWGREQRASVRGMRLVHRSIDKTGSGWVLSINSSIIISQGFIRILFLQASCGDSGGAWGHVACLQFGHCGRQRQINHHQVHTTYSSTYVVV